MYRNCFRHSEQFLYITCSPHILQKEELLTKIFLHRVIVNFFWPNHFEISRADMDWMSLYVMVSLYGEWVEEIYESIKKMEEDKKTMEGEKKTISGRKFAMVV